ASAGRVELPVPRGSRIRSSREPSRPPRSASSAPGRPGPPGWHTSVGPDPSLWKASVRPSDVFSCSIAPRTGARILVARRVELPVLADAPERELAPVVEVDLRAGHEVAHGTVTSTSPGSASSET